MKKYLLTLCIIPYVLCAKDKQEYVFSEGKKDAYRLDFQNNLLDKELCKALSYATALNNLQGKVIIDLGCGVSSAYQRIESFIGKEGTYIGIDVSEKQIEVAKEKYPHLKYLCGDLINPEVRAELASADFIYLRAVVMHQKDPVSFLTDLYQMVKQGAVIIIQEPENTQSQKNAMQLMYPSSALLCEFKEDLGARRGFDYNFAGKIERVLEDFCPTMLIHLHENLWVTCSQAKFMFEELVNNLKKPLLKSSFSEEELQRYEDAAKALPVSDRKTWFLDELHTFIVMK